MNIFFILWFTYNTEADKNKNKKAPGRRQNELGYYCDNILVCGVEVVRGDLIGSQSTSVQNYLIKISSLHTKMYTTVHTKEYLYNSYK